MSTTAEHAYDRIWDAFWCARYESPDSDLYKRCMATVRAEVENVAKVERALALDDAADMLDGQADLGNPSTQDSGVMRLAAECVRDMANKDRG